ncbi:unnamed protein product [Dracunculus medinensis]|uniref:Bestrophin homolog n=1 Tax=Dracunculus medinensis TaxID=318479 RepID=A0A0N4UGQ7_DRAME|nr:unnamed protein product [Dracunculus medinensis]
MLLFEIQAAIAWSGVSVRTLKRFPTERHLVETNLMTEEEYSLYMSMDAPHGKWFVPIMWIINLIKTMHRQKRIDSVHFDMIMRQIYLFRDGFAMLFVYDWIKIPLVYTQVVAIATYGYFVICLIGRQPKLDQRSMEKEITILFPIFTTFQILFYIELNYVLDRNTCIANMIATDLADQLPSISKQTINITLPHTRASFKIQDVIPRSHLSNLKLSENEMELIKPEELEESSDIVQKKNARLRSIVRGIQNSTKLFVFLTF